MASGTSLPRLAALAAAMALASHAASGEPPPPGSGTSAPAKAPLDAVTVQAPRERKEVEREVDQFVFAVAVRYLHDSLSRWNTPICPLVAGLTRDEGEFVLARLSEIAGAAKAPLAGEHCEANFYVVVSPQPEILISKWQARDHRLFNTRNGMGYLREFRDTARAVHVWYNVEFAPSGGGPILSSDALVGAIMGGTSLSLQMADVPTNRLSAASKLTHSAVRSLSSVIVIVDATRVQGLSFGQLADYIGMVGLAEVNQDAEVGSLPTILQLFRPSPDPPLRLSAWDEAFLASLYGIDQGSVVEQPRMKRQMVSSLAPAR